MNEDELNVDDLTPLEDLDLGEATGDTNEAPQALDLSMLTDEQRADIAIQYAVKSGEFVPRSWLDQQQQAQDPGDENDNYDATDGETVEQYVNRRLAAGLQQMRQEVEKTYGVSHNYGATQSVVSMVEGNVQVPSEAKQYLSSIVSNLIKNDPSLPGKLIGPQAIQTQEWIADLAIGRAYREGKIAPRTPVTQREPGSLPSGMSMREGVTVAQLNEARALYKGVHGTEPTKEKMKELGWVK